jgi:hypothetical protein
LALLAAAQVAEVNGPKMVFSPISAVAASTTWLVPRASSS